MFCYAGLLCARDSDFVLETRLGTSPRLPWQPAPLHLWTPTIGNKSAPPVPVLLPMLLQRVVGMGGPVTLVNLTAEARCPEAPGPRGRDRDRDREVEVVGGLML